ncbi:uncharacterized protein LOC109824430 [Asparagus officinalis]|uniref:uncharacterized protein LOC109824430 n=1 Tax=Asparagus officinalis TaxID=4686 RepID=UPI00098E1B78|nr:uncharacterized protein LOC109824430 [Asparagus officinalis]
MTAVAAGNSLTEQVVRPTKEVSMSTAATSATILTIHEVVQAEPSTGCCLEEASFDFGPSSRFNNIVKALLSDDDPNKVLLRMEITSFFSFVNDMIDKLISKGLSPGLFKSYMVY